MEKKDILIKEFKNLNRDELSFLYEHCNMSQIDIANSFGKDSSTVCRKFRKENVKANKKSEFISAKQLNNKCRLSKNDLVLNYPVKSITEISNEYNCSHSYVYSKLKEFGIKIEKNGFFQKVSAKKNNLLLKGLSESILKNLYLKEKFSMNEIADIFETDKNYIKRRLKEFGIKIRTKTEAFNTERHKKKRGDIVRNLLDNNIGVFIPLYNKNSIPIIEKFGKDNGFNFQHAENGGEIFLEDIFVWVDAYDKEKNVVLEFYEKEHKYRKEKDKKRVKKIVKYLKCKLFIIHESGLIEEY